MACVPRPLARLAATQRGALPAELRLNENPGFFGNNQVSGCDRNRRFGLVAAIHYSLDMVIAGRQMPEADENHDVN